MVRNQKVTGKTMSMPAGLALGGAVSLGITILGAVIAGKLLDGEVIPQSAIGYAAMAILLLASLAGALTACGKIKRQRLVVCLASGGIYYALLLSMTALFFGGQYNGMGVTALMVLAGCGLSILMESRSEGKGRRKRKIRAHR